MTQHDPLVRLRHMLDYAREAVEMTGGRTRADLDQDRQLNLSLARLLEMIGEAAARVPPADRERWSGVPWPDIVGLRNRLVHGYDEVGGAAELHRRHRPPPAAPVSPQRRRERGQTRTREAVEPCHAATPQPRARIAPRAMRD